MTIFAVLMILFGVVSVFGASDWAGWRGNEAQGVSSTSGPLTWSADQNVIWKSDVQGQGHSSPVVVGEKVLVTTAYPTESGPELRPLAIRLINIIALIVAVVAAIHVVSLIREQKVAQAIVIALFAGLFAKEFTSAVRYAFGTHREAHYLSWIDSHLVLGIACLLAMQLVVHRVRFLFGIGLIGLAASMMYLRPDPEYYGFTTGAHHLRATSTVILLTLFITGVVAVLASIFLKKEGAATPDDATTVEPGRSNPALWVVVALVAGFGSFGVPLFVQQIRAMLPGIQVPWILLQQIGARACAIALAAIVWCVWARRFAPARNHFGMVTGTLAVAGLTFVTTNYLRSVDTHGRAIVCLDANTGEQLWSCEGLYGAIPSTHMANSPASPTPVVHGDRVFAYFGSAGMMASDLDGKLQWTNRELPFDGIHGVAASPIAFDGAVYLTSANSKAPYIVALSCESGDRLWTAKLDGWEGVHGEHRTPMIVESDSTPTLLNWSMKSTLLTGVDITNGCERYQFDTGIENTGEAVASILLQDGILYLPSKSTVAALRLPKKGGELDFLWQTELRSNGPNTASPVIHNGLMFLVSDSGVASCLDIETGRPCWKKRLPPGSYYSSPIVMGDHVYFSNDRGLTTVVLSDSKFQQVSKNELPDGIYASSAPRDGKLLIRTESAIWCIGENTIPTKKDRSDSSAIH